MTITYEEEKPTPKIVYEERRKFQAVPAPSGPLRILTTVGDFLDKAAYKSGEIASDAATSAGLSPENAAKVGMVANVGVQAIPTFGAGAVGSKVAPLFEKGARSMMQSALKPTLANLESGNAAKAIDTMLKGGFSATEGGVAAMQGQISKLNNEIMASIANSTATVDKAAVASRLQDSLKKFSMQVNPQADVRAIERAWTEFIQHPMLAGRTSMSVQEAQAMKQGTYKALGDKAFGEMKGAEIEAQKQLARGLKEEVAAAVPGVATLNKKESELLNALQVAERRALMDGNKNPAGLSLLANHPGAFAAFMADKSALFKSLVARMMHSGQATIPVNAARTVGAAVGASTASPPSE